MLDAPPPLEELLEAAPIALFLDFDGTLVELAPTPDAIAPIAGLARKLETLADRLGGACAVVSGRALDDIERNIGSLAIAGAGSHGADIRDANGDPLGEGAQGLPDGIAKALGEYAKEHGLGYESKPHGAALHYRGKEAKGPAAHAFAERLADQHGWITQSGKCVVELVAGKADKGSAVQTLLTSHPFAGRRPFFIGDDLTDEKGFAACMEAGGGGILVGEREPTAANYHLPDVASVHRWLGL